MRTPFRLLACLSLLLLLPAACGKKDLSNAVAVVNGDVVSKARFDVAMESFARRLGAPNPSMLDTPEVRQQVLDNLVAVQLLFQAAQKAGYSASPEGVERVYKEFRGNFPTEEEYTKELASRGLTEEMVREDVARQLILEGYVDKALGIPDPSDKEIADFYAANVPPQARASHILFKATEAEGAAARKAALAKAEKTRARILKGEDFAKLAKELSGDPGSAANGGDLGLFSKGQMVPSFDEAVFSQPIGEVGKPVASEFGYHIIKVTERLPPKPLSEVRESIVDYLKRGPVQEALEKKVEELKAKAKIEILLAEPAPAPAGTADHPAKD